MRLRDNYLLKNFLRKNSWWIVLVLASILISNSFRVAAASCVQWIVNILENCRTNGLGPFFGIVALAAISMILFYVTRALIQYLCAYLAQKLCVETRVRLMSHLSRISFRQFEEKETGDMESVLRNDVQISADLLRRLLSGMVSNTVLVIFTAAYMISVNVMAGTTVTVVVFTLALVNKYILTFYRKYQVQEREAVGELTSVIENSYKGIDTVKTYHVRDYVLDLFRKRKDRYNTVTMQAEKADALRSCLLYNAMHHICLYGSMVYLGCLGIAGQLNIGQVIVFVTLLRDFMMPVNNMVGYTAAIVRANAAWKRIYDVLQIPADAPQAEAEQAHLPVTRMHAEGLTYAYDGKTNVIDNMTLDLEKGKLHVLVGESGSGKTTLFKVLTGLYHADSLKLIVNGVPQDKEKVFGSIVYVPAHSPLFQMSIYENLTLGDTTITREQCLALAKELGLYDWICSLPDGIDSEILENAKNLSGGQQQMLCNMRALLSRAPVLILDEPAGALDKHRQALLEHVLDRMKHEKILLLSSHRMDMIEHCDCVIAMQ